MMIRTALDTAIKFAGSQAALAKAIGYSQQSISYWRAQENIPPIAAVKIHQFTKGKAPASRLCPAVFGKNGLEGELREAS